MPIKTQTFSVQETTVSLKKAHEIFNPSMKEITEIIYQFFVNLLV